MDEYFSFKGSSTRSEYWAIQLISWGILILILTVGALIMGVGFAAQAASAGVLGILVMLAGLVIPVWLLLTVTVRRCRNADINPWWTLSTLIPYIGWIPWIVIGVLPTANKDVQT